MYPALWASVGSMHQFGGWRKRRQRRDIVVKSVEDIRTATPERSGAASTLRYLTLLHGFAPDTPPAARWQPLAHQKLSELDELIARAQQMKRVLEKGLNCGCLHIEDCAIVLEEGCCKEQTALDIALTNHPF